MKQISNSHLRWPKGRRSCVKYISKERINNESMGTIIPVEDVDKLKDLIINYDQIVAGMEHEMSSNNAKFNKKLEKIVDELVVR